MSDAEDLYPVRAPGWAAIDRALAMVHPGQTPHQFTSATAYDLDSASPLPAVSVYEGQSPLPHWHFVTYGLTELFDKSSPDADVSGFGFELTLRLLRDPSEERPPAWPLRLLQGIGGHVLSARGGLDTGHVIALGEPLRPVADGPTLLEGLLCVPDPRLGKIDTVHGSVLFLALFGLTAAECEAVVGWELERKVALVQGVSPSAITVLHRRPLLDDPITAPAWRRAELGILLDR